MTQQCDDGVLVIGAGSTSIGASITLDEAGFGTTRSVFVRYDLDHL